MLFYDSETPDIFFLTTCFHYFNARIPLFRLCLFPKTTGTVQSYFPSTRSNDSALRIFRVYRVFYCLSGGGSSITISSCPSIHVYREFEVYARSPSYSIPIPSTGMKHQPSPIDISATLYLSCRIFDSPQRVLLAVCLTQTDPEHNFPIRIP